MLDLIQQAQRGECRGLKKKMNLTHPAGILLFFNKLNNLSSRLTLPFCLNTDATLKSAKTVMFGKKEWVSANKMTGLLRSDDYYQNQKT